MDAQAAHEAAEHHARTGDVVHDKSDMLPIDERYKDDGTVSRVDKEKYSLRTGATVSTAAVRDPSSASMSHRISEDALIGEMKGGRKVVLALIAIGIVAVILIVFLIAR
jgi:hypothetical protein